ncbi:enoyl-CoA hydratase/isomerase family protein [Bradyrhizobium sp. DASA03007]|uniref:enoyl-CoA hydratase/isomerase family protein n=1 Tax=unclassified Bradyrhizobium TaxID=2631580 RepID=UPI003F724C8A
MTEGQQFAHRPEDLLSEMRDRIFVLTINRQESYNSWTQPLRDELTRQLLFADANPDIDAVILTGAGEKAFCSGQDLAEMEELPDGGEMKARLERLMMCYDAVRQFSKPLVAALNGVAAGSGFQVTQFCDYVVAHPKVRVGQTEVKSGLPSVFGTWLMWERIGSRAIELSLQGRLMVAEEAKQLGFIHEIVKPAKVLEAALDAARRLANQPRLAYKLSKAASRQFDQERYCNAMQMAIAAYRVAFNTGDPQKEISQFFDSRSGGKAGADAS